ncbi:glycosyltransferase [Spirosoma fluviale]|uniref:Glycosyltransferase involved in cell wall bisynthesis n=1 Tax=Spirosoma fluviale TaxID=1597977 RepID=A0A286FD83_9BACT|nr:glycosyltransferase [Spirosoma fluviale]SOD81201.1 Glycosyltransferase involved in cell wall bisynthesis [Spirosoma fluviale]
MNITLINTFDVGGAAKSCIRLHQGLLAEEITSVLLLKQKTQNIANSVRFQPLEPVLSTQKKIRAKLKRIALELKIVAPPKDPIIPQITFLKQRPKGLEAFSFHYTDIDLTQSPEYLAADIINLHWVADFLDWQSFFIKNTKPVVWTLHDQNPFLGGEHYAERYLGLDAQGYPISRKYTEQEQEEEKKILDIKRSALEQVKNLHIVAPSKWLVESSQNSELLGRFSHHHIPYGYPTDIFKPYDRLFCREVLGIPQDKTVLLFVADSVDNSRKGYVYLQKALECLSETHQQEVFLCAIGSKAHLSSNHQVIELGHVHDERLMAMAYSAANAFVIPSLEDNLPNTMIESALCGTPVIGFNTGGIPSIVINAQTGYLCPEISVQSLRETIEKFLDNPTVFDREKIAHEAKEKYALEVQAQRYIQLYESILSQ